MMGQPQRHFASIGSTNDAAREWARDGASHGAIVTADAQTAGRGRRGRTWSSPAGKGLYLSLIIRPEGGLEIVPRLTMLAALAVVRAVRASDQLSCQTKWPNDVLLHGRKIAGVLCEAEWKAAQLDFAIVGLGINVNLEAADLPSRALYPAASLLLETGRTWNLDVLRQAWVREFDTLLRLIEAGQWPRLRGEFWNRCAQRGNFVTIASEAETIQGIATGLDEDGALLVQTGTEERRILAGDVLAPTPDC